MNAVPGIGPATFDADKFWPDPPPGSLLGPARRRLDPIVADLGIADWFHGAGREALDAIGRLFIGEHEGVEIEQARPARAPGVPHRVGMSGAHGA